MWAYYRAQETLPTFGNLKTEGDLDKYRAQRERFLKDKLYLPPRLFYDCDLLQFGPDSGEDALVFAQWGAHLRLVEPNPKALTVLHEYFHRFKLERHLKYVSIMSLEQWDRATDSQTLVDFIDAEGFIQTVAPAVWMPLFARVLRPGGLCLISYPDQYGVQMDLMHRAIYEQVRQLDPTITAENLFLTKWNTIPHTRAFESWVLDELENPFFTAAQTYETHTLDRQMNAAGFRLYSSWPERKHAGAVYWHKARPDRTTATETLVEMQQAAACNQFVLEKVRRVLESGDVFGIVKFCNEDADFLAEWGTAYWFGCYERVNNA